MITEYQNEVKPIQTMNSCILACAIMLDDEEGAANVGREVDGTGKWEAATFPSIGGTMRCMVAGTGVIGTLSDVVA